MSQEMNIGSSKQNQQQQLLLLLLLLLLDCHSTITHFYGYDNDIIKEMNHLCSHIKGIHHYHHFSTRLAYSIVHHVNGTPTSLVLSHRRLRMEYQLSSLGIHSVEFFFQGSASRKRESCGQQRKRAHLFFMTMDNNSRHTTFFSIMCPA